MAMGLARTRSDDKITMTPYARSPPPAATPIALATTTATATRTTTINRCGTWEVRKARRTVSPSQMAVTMRAALPLQPTVRKT